MYTGTLKRAPFQPDSTMFQHAAEREEYMKNLRDVVPHEQKREFEKKPESLAKLLEIVSPEDSALIALVVFLLCDNTENDVVLLGILLYVLLSK